MISCPNFIITIKAEKMLDKDSCSSLLRKQWHVWNIKCQDKVSNMISEYDLTAHFQLITLSI